jgi:hypothetical protein
MQALERHAQRRGIPAAFLFVHLRAVGVGAGVGHGQHAAARVLQVKVFVLKLASIACSVIYEGMNSCCKGKEETEGSELTMMRNKRHGNFRGKN